MTSKDLGLLLHLHGISGLGPKKIKALINHFGGIKSVFQATSSELFAIKGLTIDQALSIINYRPTATIQRELEWIKSNRINVNSLWDENYPHWLKHIPDSPTHVFSKGQFNWAERSMIAVVGSRDMSEYGRDFTESLIAVLAPYNPVIVSGLAYGVDACAHRAAINNGLRTIAVLGHGLNKMYPAVHRPLSEHILARKGVLLTEYCSQTMPEKENFPMRNRIVAGMCQAVVVIEAKERGGALITAQLANGYSREVFALPGRFNDENSQGCNDLIYQNKAIMLKNPEDLIKELNLKKDHQNDFSPQVKLFIDTTPEEQQLIDVLQNSGKLHVDELCFRIKKPSYKAMELLLNLEMKRVVIAHPGKFYSLHN